MEKYLGGGLEHIDCIVEMEEFLKDAEELNCVAKMSNFVSCITEFFQNNGLEMKGLMWDVIRFFEEREINPFFKLRGVDGIVLREKYLIEYLEHQETEEAKKTLELIKQSENMVILNFVF